MKKRLSRRQFIKRALIGGTALATVDTLWLEHFFVDFNHYSIDNTPITDAAIKVVQLTDFHIKSFGWGLKRMIHYVNELQADLICFTGDMYDDKGRLGVLEELLQALDSSIPKVAILGNWEYWSRESLDGLSHLYQKYNIQLLVNQTTTITIKDTSFSIIGIDDLLGGRPDYMKAKASSVKSDYKIILNHCPEYNDTILDLDPNAADLILSGHTHGGQVNILGWAPGLPPGSGRFVGEWYKDRKVPIYVCRGLGTSVLPIRFGARAEVAVFYFLANVD